VAGNNFLGSLASGLELRWRHCRCAAPHSRQRPGNQSRRRVGDWHGGGGIWDRAALNALPRDQRPKYDESCTQGPPFSVRPDEIERLLGERFTVFLLDKADLPAPAHLAARVLERELDAVYSLRRN
jgi:hypothetical protein